MSGEGDLGHHQTGAVLLALGKLEEAKEESQRQSAKHFDKLEEIARLVTVAQQQSAAYQARVDTVINQLVASAEDHEDRINDLEDAQQQRAGAGRLGGSIGHAMSAIAGGVVLWVLQNLQRLMGH